jgi:uncharacterized protein YjiS (DUF1127 family)
VIEVTHLRHDLLDKPDHGATQFCIFDTHERLHQIQAVGCREEVGHVGGRGSFSRHPSRWPNARRGRRALEEKRNRHLKDLGYVLQSAGADAVETLLVFLNLLEYQPEGVRDIGLAHIEYEPPHAQTAADMLVGWINGAPRRSCPR